MAAPQVAGIPPGIVLADGYVARFVALNPTTGATVANVVVSSATLQLNNLTDRPADQLVSGPYILVPGPAA